MPKSKKNLQEEDLKDIVEESVKEEVKEEPKEEAKEEKKEEEKPETHEDVEALKKEIADLKNEVSTQTEKMSKEMVGKLSDVFGLKKSEDPKDQTPWDKEGRQPTWTEALEYTAEKTHERIKSDLETVEKQEKEQAKTQEENQVKFNENINKYWDTQIDELVAAGKLPAVKDAKDEKDEGKLFRIELFKTMVEVNKEREAKGLDAISNLKEIYYEHFKAPTEQPAGENAPVFGAVHGGATNTAEKVPYNEFHRQGIEDIVREQG
jgi:hypothetical protein